MSDVCIHELCGTEIKKNGKAKHVKACGAHPMCPLNAVFSSDQECAPLRRWPR